MRTYRRFGAYAASATLALSGTLGGALVAAAPADAAPLNPVGIDYGSAWLVGQLTNGLMHNPNFGGFDDYGLTVDAGLALEQTNSSAAGLQVIKTAMAQHVDDYVTPFGGPHSYTGGLAKLAVFAGPAGATSFGGQNLVTKLATRVSTTAPITGRIEDAGYKPGDQFDDDTANVLGQAYAVNALTRASSPKAASAVDFLLAQQCPDGGFRLNFTKDKTATGQSCTDNADDDTDATAIAVAQLRSSGSTRSGVSSALTRGTAWLVSTQKADGSWGGGTSTEASNANSTGLAAWAIGASSQATKAAGWLRDRQVTYYDVCDALLRERGAVAYDDAALANGRREGITTGLRDQWRRATAQAVPALEFLAPDSPPSDPKLSGPTGYFRQGAHVNLTTTGVKAGDRLCLNGVGAKVQGTSTGESWTRAVTLPTGTARRSYAVRDTYGHIDLAFVEVLGARTLTVTRTPGVAHRNATVTVAVRGLAPHELAKIVYGGRVVRSGEASASGNLVGRFSVGTSLGRHSILGYGRFTDIRKGASAVTVVR